MSLTYAQAVKRTVIEIIFEHNLANRRSKQDRAGLKRGSSYIELPIMRPPVKTFTTFRLALKKCPFPVRYNFHRSRLIFASDADKMQFLMEAYQ